MNFLKPFHVCAFQLFCMEINSPFRSISHERLGVTSWSILADGSDAGSQARSLVDKARKRPSHGPTRGLWLSSTEVTSVTQELVSGWGEVATASLGQLGLQMQRAEKVGGFAG